MSALYCPVCSEVDCECGMKLSQRIQELEAQCAAMREALGYALKAGDMYAELRESRTFAEARAALSADAGKAILERLRRAEDLADGDLVNARLAQMKERAERAEEEVRLSNEFDKDWEEAEAKTRARALEEAAKVVSEHTLRTDLVVLGDAIIAGIRALKEAT